MSDRELNNNKQQAEDLCQKATDLLHKGQISAAIDMFKSSITIFPTAMAHTNLGWAYSREGKYDLAIKECFLAIEIEPDSGSAYNDIGAYLVQKGKVSESEEWFRKAADAPMYEARHFALTNLARVMQFKGYWMESLALYDKALEIRSDYAPAKESRILLQAMMN